MSSIGSSQSIGGSSGGTATGGVQKTERTDIVTRIGAYKSGFTSTSSQSNAYSAMRMPSGPEIQKDVEHLTTKLVHLSPTVKATMDEAFDTNLNDVIEGSAPVGGFSLKELD